MEKCNVPGNPEFITTAQKLVFYQGQIMEGGIQKWAHGVGIGVGHWKCGACGRIHDTDIGPKPSACLDCGFGLFHYEQVRAKSQDSGISAGLDLLVKLPGLDKLRIIECKTYPKDEFQALATPLAEHRDRTRLYLRCAEEDPRYADIIDTEYAHVFYVSKGGWGQKSGLPKKWGIADGPWSPFKEFLIRADHDSVEPYAKKARPLWAWKNGGPMCGGICSTGFDKAAQKCEVLKECFSGDHPAG